MPKTLLFADDELQYIEGLIETARAEGYNVLICRDATKAFKLVMSGKIDCLVIDIQMNPGEGFSSVDPQKGGLVTIDEILKQKPRQSIICLSVISDQTVIDGLKRRGVLYLRKAETSLDKAWRTIESKITGVYRDGGTR